LGWSERRSTKAAQKLPANHIQKLHEAFIREAWIIRDHNIPPSMRVNTDQTQLVYQQGTKTTWNERGAKQVAVVGQEEKRALTLVPSITETRLLPWQGIYHGKTSASLQAIGLGYVMLPSKSSTYWSTHETMRFLADDIIAPYFDEERKRLDLPDDQAGEWKIDCWSLHKSKKFRRWMKIHHPNIILNFVVGGCT
ncbi:hypothetical protein C8R43DRAFT_836135, partial [Mycena crocata]